jgi:hypothetical protein
VGITNWLRVAIGTAIGAAAVITAIMTVGRPQSRVGTVGRPQSALPPVNSFQTGMTEAGYKPTVFSSPAVDNSMRALRQNGVRWLSIQTAWYQPTDDSTEIAPSPTMTPTDASIVHLIKLSHRLGMRVFMDPFVNASSGNAWQADFHPPSWSAWFKAYDRAIVHYARLSQQNGVDLFAIGDENDSSDMNPALYAEYRTLIQQVRAVYHGKVTYGSDWPDYQKVTFWPLLDVVGIDAYFSLATGTGDPPTANLAAAWNRTANTIQSWRTKAGRHQPVIITELGYPSEVGAAQKPAFWVPDKPTDLTIQTRLYQATFQSIYRRPWLQGIYWFWWLNPSNTGWPGGPKDNGYGLQGKPALAVLRYYFTRPRTVTRST